MNLHRLFERENRRGHGWSEDLERNNAFQRAILAIPSGRVSTYGKIAETAGYPRYHRAVARLLSGGYVERIPWHRIVAADGQIKTKGACAKEQRARLCEEGVSFRGDRVDLSVFLYRPGIVAGPSAGE